MPEAGRFWPPDISQWGFQEKSPEDWHSPDLLSLGWEKVTEGVDARGLQKKMKPGFHGQRVLSLEVHPVLRPRAGSLPDLRGGVHLHAGSDHPVLPDAARTSQQRHLLGPPGRVPVELLQHPEQYPLPGRWHQNPAASTGFTLT